MGLHVLKDKPNSLLHTHTQTCTHKHDRLSGRKTNGQTDRQTDIQSGKQAGECFMSIHRDGGIFSTFWHVIFNKQRFAHKFPL